MQYNLAKRTPNQVKWVKFAPCFALVISLLERQG